MGAPRVVARVINADGRPFNVILVLPGDCYGLDDGLTYRGDAPCVEFWDATYEDDPHFMKGRGQFVTRYYLHTLIDKQSAMAAGLNLCGHEPVWRLTGTNVAAAITAVKAALRDGTPPKTVQEAALRK